MQDIVTASQMSKGAIFHHFRSKEEVFEAAMAREFTLAKERFTQYMQSLTGATGREKLIKLLLANFSDGEMEEAILHMVNAKMYSPHLLVSEMKNSLHEIAPFVAAIIREGVADGSIITDYPLELAEVYLLLYNYWCDVHPFGGGLAAIRQRLVFLQHIMAALGCDIITEEIIACNMTLIKKYRPNMEEA